MAVNGNTIGSIGHAEHTEHAHATKPFRTVGDFLSNVSNFQIIESTLREGEQFANAFFDTETKIRIARALDDFGVEYIELTSPASMQELPFASFSVSDSAIGSEQSRRDCETIANLGLKAKILTHVRCNMEDARLAVETGVDGVDVVIGTSSYLREHSHGKDMSYIIKTAVEVIEYVKSTGKEIRFSSEDSFRSDLVDLLSIYSAVDKVGIADTVGVATPREVYDLVRTLRGVVRCDIECHFHNDTGCAIANAYCALEAGATHVDTSVLGIGERNGIPSLGGFVVRISSSLYLHLAYQQQARMLTQDREYVKSKYNLTKLKAVEDLVADAVEVNVPFNNPITGFCAFTRSETYSRTQLRSLASPTQLSVPLKPMLILRMAYTPKTSPSTHKAGIHAKAILANPATYEIINPADFGIQRYVHFASRLTGWNAIKSRCDQLGLDMTDAQIKQCTAKVKAMADVRKLAIEDTDVIINQFYHNLNSDYEKPLLEDLTLEEKEAFAKKDRELNGMPEMDKLDKLVKAQVNGDVRDHV
ncbi:MAG: hypothetical protein Q9213_005117 [Squamulea squamosa]